MSQLITDRQRLVLLANGARYEKGEDFSPFPVVKLWMPRTGFIWLLASLEPEYPWLGFALADLALGFPEMGIIDLQEIIDCCETNKHTLLADTDFVPTKPLSAYADDARKARRIVTEPATMFGMPLAAGPTNSDRPLP